ncbi:PspA/IM30 family protein [Cypionkella sinensis]|uniref:PspA/IM30 family protein n=1 Tax=Cypionkella sinensis TaxID=1756043 RepID=A0ABV7IVN9_9RHOB
MFKLFVTLLRGRNADAAESLTDAAALPILRQQLRDCAAGVETARRAVAMVMTYAERERKASARISAQLADLETRALAALAQGREDLATEAAGAIAQLEAEAATTASALATYDAEIAHLRSVLSDAETRLRDLQRGQRLAIATDHSQRLHGAATVATLDEAEATLARLQTRQSNLDATRAAMLELSASTNAEAMQNRLAALGCGAPLRPDAASVLQRLKARAA